MNNLLSKVSVWFLVLQIVVGFLSIKPLLAQTQENTSLRKALQSVSSAVIALATDDSLASGEYKFKNEIGPDAQMDLYKLVIEIPLTDSSAKIVPLFEVNPSYLKLSQDLGQVQDNAEFRVTSQGLGLGAGLRLSLFDDLLFITPRFKVDYTEFESEFRTGAPSFIQGELESNAEIWTLIPSIELNYLYPLGIGSTVAQYSSQISYVFNDATSSDTDLGDYSDESWVIKNSAIVEIPIGSPLIVDSLMLRPQVSRIDVYGSARDGLEFNNFYEFGTELIAKDVSSVLSEVGLGITYMYEKEIQGWRLGIIVKFT